MVERKDWLDETWEIKKTLARQYAGKPMSEQLREIQVHVREAFHKRGWDYPESPTNRHATHQHKIR